MSMAAIDLACCNFTAILNYIFLVFSRSLFKWKALGIIKVSLCNGMSWWSSDCRGSDFGADPGLGF